MKTAITLATGLLGAALLAGCAGHRSSMGAAPAGVAATTTTTTTTTMAAAPAASRLSAADVQFVAVAAGSGMYEVEASRVALSRATDPQVRAYAQMLVDHHTTSNNELMTIVGTKGQRIAPALPASLQQKVTMLSGLSGPAFDREYVRMTGVQDHRAAIAAFEQAQGSVADRDLQAFIVKTLPVLRSHLQQAQDIAGRMAG